MEPKLKVIVVAALAMFGCSKAHSPAVEHRMTLAAPAVTVSVNANTGLLLPAISNFFSANSLSLSGEVAALGFSYGAITGLVSGGQSGSGSVTYSNGVGTITFPASAGSSNAYVNLNGLTDNVTVVIGTVSNFVTYCPP